MQWVKYTLAVLFTCLFAAAGAILQVDPAEAQDAERKTTIIVPYTEYEWWMISWASGQVVCELYVDHEGVPTASDVYEQCGSDIGALWEYTPPCRIDENEGETVTDCKGYYMFLVGSKPMQKEVVVDLPPAVVWVDLKGCSPTPPENLCQEIPSLLLIGEEPLPNERITAIHGTYDGEPFTCPGDVCELPLRPTSLQGSLIEFWADSSFGDSSAVYTAMVRVIDTGVSETPGRTGWYVDVISTQWIGAPLASCGRIWQSFPPIGYPPEWLDSPEHNELLASDNPYYYLAGRLIVEGLVDVSECPGTGLLPNGYADVCGLEKSTPLIEDWQNQFDQKIIEVSNETGIPTQLLKNLFAEESQFWPGVFRVPYEYGLGQITDNGADTILLWDDEFFEQFCPLVFVEETCQDGYLAMNEHEQQVLRGALALQAKVDCEECPTGVDLNETVHTVDLFANTLLASCEQVSQTINNATAAIAGEVSTYEDLWRYTVANYHAGSGCVSFAIHQAWQNEGLLNWELVKQYFTEPCKGVVPYVEKITGIE